jgi:Fur family ferric uptake transcriptional regulator
MEQRIEKIKQLLQAQSYKLTSQREGIVRVLLENEKDHLSAEEVFMIVRESEPDIGLATVYRTLELLTELKILHKMNFGDGVARYDLHTENSEHHHHHLVCIKCGAVDEIMDDWLGPIEALVEKEYHFHILDHRLVFQGVCYRCNNRSKPDKLL